MRPICGSCLPQVVNWALGLERVGLRNYVLFSADDRIHSFLQSLGAPSFFYATAAKDDASSSSGAASALEVQKSQGLRKACTDKYAPVTTTTT